MSNYLTDRRKELGLTMKQVAQAVGVAEATVSRWESGQIANMKRDKINTYAKVLRVSPTFIMTGEAEESGGRTEENMEPGLTDKDRRDISKKPEETLDLLGNSTDGLMFDGEPLDDETRELLRASLQNQLEMTKRIAKQKFTPKKYRK